MAYRINKLPADFRLVGPKYLYERRAEFTVWVPEGRAEADFVVVVRSANGLNGSRNANGEVARLTVDLTRPFGDWAPAGVKAARFLADASAWKDGEYRAELRMAGAATQPSRPAGTTTQASRQAGATIEASEPEPLARIDFAVVRKKVDADWSPPLREELAVWLEHANRPRDIWKKVPFWHNLDRVIAAPESLYDGLRGLALRSYHNPQLERLQPYAMYVPKAYDPAAPMPLMVLLHGSGGNYLNVVSDLLEGQELQTNPMLVANAGAFAYQEYRHMALNDVLWVIEDVRKKYNVDAERIYLQGISLGGRGAMEIAALRPELFAAICPQGTYGVIAEPSDPAYFAAQEPYSQWSVARMDLRSYLLNLRHVPMQLVYGYRDKTTPALNALTFAHLVNTRFDGRAETAGFDADHNISFPQYKWSDTRAWLLRHARVRDPEVVGARTATLRFNRFYWVTIEAMEVQWQMAHVNAGLDKAGTTLQVQTRNVERLTLEPPRRPARIVADETEIELPQAAPAGPIRLRRGRQGWALEGASSTQPASGPAARPDAQGPAGPSPDAAAAPVKRHGQSGPIWDVMHGRCVCAYGTGGTNKETDRLRQIAQHVAGLDATWGAQTLTVLPDRDVTDEIKRTRNLFLVGDARTNLLLAGHDWPFDLKAVGRGEGIKVFGQTFQDPGDVLMFIYPSPFAADAYVYVVSPARPGEALPVAMNPSWAWDSAAWSDWLVRRYWLQTGVDPVKQALVKRLRGELRMDGVFDGRWRLEPMPGKSLPGRPMNWE